MSDKPGRNWCALYKAAQERAQVLRQKANDPIDLGLTH